MKLQDKRILLVLERGTLGGAERQALGLARYLAYNNYCYVDLLFTSSNFMTREFESFLKTSGVRSTFFYGEPYIFLKKEFSILNLKRFAWSIQYLIKLRRNLISEKYDVIIPFLNFPSKISYYLSILLPTVKYTFWHQLGLDTWKYDLFEKFAVKNVPIIIGNASNCFDVFKDYYGLSDSKLKLLPQYVSLQREVLDRRKLRLEYDIGEQKIVFGMISHFRRFKYHNLVLDVFTKLLENYDNIHLILMGNAENDTQARTIFDELREAIEYRDIKESVTLLNNQSVPKILNLLDVGLLLSMIEGTPNIVLEYMLYGLPVIASAHPGCKSMLDSKNFLIEENNSEDIYEAMEQLLKSAEMRESLGEINRDSLKNFSIESYVQKLEGYLE